MNRVFLAIVVMGFCCLMSTVHLMAGEPTSEQIEKMQQQLEQLRASGILETSLQVGDMAPNFILPNAHGNMVNLYHLLDEKPVVLTFYRGGWCIYCNRALNELQLALREIEEEGAFLVAVSPEKQDKALATIAKNALTFEVLSDEGSEIGKECGVTFELSEELRPIYKEFGIDVEAHNGEGDFQLPIPATYVIDMEYMIVWSFKDVDYQKRANPEDIIDVVELINQRE